MLTLSELKYYNKFDGTDNDVFFQQCIAMATGNIEAKCKRKFIYNTHTEYFNIDSRGYYSYELEDYIPFGFSNNKQAVFLGNLPIVSLTSIEELNSDGTYTTIFTGTDTITDSSITNNSTGEVSLIKGYAFPYGNNSTKIVYKAGYKFSQLTGTVSNSANGNTITGVGTLFTTELSVGDKIIIGNERKTITTITSNTSLTVDFNFINANGTAVSYLNNYPDDLRKFCFELATWIYYQSPHSSKKILGVTSMNQGGQSNVGISFEEPNWSDIIQAYKVYNI